jgi:hypothetical protein
MGKSPSEPIAPNAATERNNTSIPNSRSSSSIPSSPVNVDELGEVTPSADRHRASTRAAKSNRKGSPERRVITRHPSQLGCAVLAQMPVHAPNPRHGVLVGFSLSLTFVVAGLGFGAP